jgi:hypothetical protein
MVASRARRESTCQSQPGAVVRRTLTGGPAVRTKRLTRGSALLGLLVAALSPCVGWADCPAPLTYDVSVNGPNVQVCPTGGYCNPDGLLRVDSAGNIVLITTCTAACYVDQCVPPGQYEYGAKTPYACGSEMCGANYFVTADLSASVAGCQRSVPAPTVYTGKLPWGASPNIVCSSGGCGASASGPVLGFNAIVLGAGLVLWRALSRRVARGA